MAKRHLEQYDAEGHLLEIYLNDDEVMVGNKTLEEKLDEIDEEMENAGKGTVKSVTLNGTKAEPDENGDVELELEVPEQVQADWEEDDPSDPAYIQHKPTVDDVLDEDSENAIANKTVTAAIAGLRQAIETVLGEGSTTAIENFQEVLDFLECVTDEETLIGLLNTMNTAINGKVDKSDVYNGLDRTTEGKVLDARQGKALNDLITALNAAVNGKLSGSDVSVSSTGDGTVVITVGNNTYTINLNHTHENMAKLIVCEESDLPSTLDNDTIYGVEESGEISVLYIGGIPFYGGGGGGVITPALRSPSDNATIDIGRIASGDNSVSGEIKIKAVALTAPLTATIDGTGFSFANTQPTGVTVVSSTQLTISDDAATAASGVKIVVVYSGSAYDADGELVIQSVTDSIYRECTLVANSASNITAIKFTKQQYIVTDIYPGVNTRLEFDMKFDGAGASSIDTNTLSRNFFKCDKHTNGTNVWAMNTNIIDPRVVNFYMNLGSAGAVNYSQTYAVDINSERSLLVWDNATNKVTFLGVDTTVDNKTVTMDKPMWVGGDPSGKPYGQFDIIIYGIKHYESGVLMHDYIPSMQNGVVGLWDKVNRQFIHSTSGTEVLAINN